MATYACFKGLGFWKHEFCGPNVKHVRGTHIDPATLLSLLPIVQRSTEIDWTRGDGVLDGEDVAYVLNRPDSEICSICEAHYLASLLNYALDGAPSSMMVDCNADGIVDVTWAQMIHSVDALFAQRDAEACLQAKAMAASVNAMPSIGCPY